MRFWVGITDVNWFQFLAARPDIAEVNFWQPTAGRRAAALVQGEAFIFKVKARMGGFIVGGGTFVHYTALPASMAWEIFGQGNGASTYEEMLARITGLRAPEARKLAGTIGCNLLTDLWFLPQERWIHPPADWPSNVQSGRWYDTVSIPGQLLWESVMAARPAGSEHAVAEPRYGQPVTVLPRLGQGAFRLLVTDAYQRRCAVTGERTLPVLDAAHIKPYAALGPHRLDNGLLLRKDLHALFDAGYVTVTPSLELRVSRRIREEFENGRDYYALQSASVRVPLPPAPPPSAEYLEWHGDAVFRG